MLRLIEKAKEAFKISDCNENIGEVFARNQYVSTNSSVFYSHKVHVWK